MERDIHLAAASIGQETTHKFEALGFAEDFFEDCRNCAPTQYHATYRGPAEDIGEALWKRLVRNLVSDPLFNGALEEEELLATENEPSEVRWHFRASPLPTQACAPDCHKACDVHIGVRLDPAAELSCRWLESLSIASFRKIRTDGPWRIFTATFDSVPAGKAFYERVVASLPRTNETKFKAKLERTVRIYRQPLDAATLPITYSPQLLAWVKAS
jgi:hypothetical protein